MRRTLTGFVAITLALVLAAPVVAETTLEKIGRTGTLTIGTRTGSPPFAYVNKNNDWVGFSIDLVEQGVVPELNKKLGKTIKVEKKESAPPTRIPLLSANSVDLIAETMTDTPERRQSVDFSLTFFLTGAQFLVKKGSPVHSLKDAAGKRVAAQQGSTNAKFLRENAAHVQLREFPDQPAAFQALMQGQVDAYTNDGIQLAGLKAKAPNPDQLEVVGEFYTREPYGMAMRKGEADFKAVVDAGLKGLIKSGKYFELYDKWFGPKGEVPYPLTAEVKKFIEDQAK
jgi:ABC-type amino acid transport substrate-binding protein